MQNVRPSFLSNNFTYVKYTSSTLHKILIFAINILVINNFKTAPFRINEERPRFSTQGVNMIKIAHILITLLHVTELAKNQNKFKAIYI